MYSGPSTTPVGASEQPAGRSEYRRAAGRLACYRPSDLPCTARFAEPRSPYRPGSPATSSSRRRCRCRRIVIAKQTNSAFIGTGLESRLRAAGIETLIVAGVITNNSVEATVRMAGNLGFDTFLVDDARLPSVAGLDGVWRTADEVHAMSLANLAGEYATVISTADALAALNRL